MATERKRSRTAPGPRGRTGDPGAPPGVGRPEIVYGSASAERYLPDWGSGDSAPIGYAVKRSAWVAPLFLLSMVAVSVVAVEASRWLTTEYVDLPRVFAGPRHLHPHGLGFRIFFAFLIAA